LKLENPKTSSSNLPHFLKHLFSIENPLEFVKQTIDLTKDVTIDEDKKTATLEIKKELKYGTLTIEMDENGELVYSMKKIIKKAEIKLVYDLKPATQLFGIGLEPIKNFEPENPLEPLTPFLSIIKQPTIPVLDLFTSQNDVAPTYVTNKEYMIPFETLIQPSYQEEFNPLEKYQKSLESSLIETNIEIHVPIDMIMTPLTHEIPKLNSNLQSVKEYKRTGFQIERYNSPQNLNGHKVYQRVILDINGIIPGATVYDSSVNAGLDIETSYHRKWGMMIDSVNGVENSNGNYWGFFVNGKAPNVAADKYPLKEGDIVEFIQTEMPKGSCFASRKRADFYIPTIESNRIGILGLPEIMYH